MSLEGRKDMGVLFLFFCNLCNLMWCHLGKCNNLPLFLCFTRPNIPKLVSCGAGMLVYQFLGVLQGEGA